MPDVPCAGRTDLMFDPARVKEAQRVCRRCHLQVQCRELGRRGVDGRSESGVWGGESETERSRRGFPSAEHVYSGHGMRIVRKFAVQWGPLAALFPDWTDCEFARVLKLDVSTVQKWRTGKRAIGRARAIEIADAFGYLPQEIWPDWLERS